MEAFHVESDRTDLVVITIQEYRDLITAGMENKALAERRLSDWLTLHEKVKALEEEIKLWKEKANAADSAYFALLESCNAPAVSEHVNLEAVNADA